MTEISSQRIQDELLAISNESDSLFRLIMGEEACMMDSLETAWHYFDDQEAGEALICLLMQTVQEIQTAYRELEQLGGAILEFTRLLAG